MPPQTDVSPLYDEAGGSLNVDPILLRAISQVESGGEKDPDRAVSSAGAVGRMQVMPEHLRRFKVNDPADPRQNIYAGAAVFDEALTAANGNVPLALRIYQGGQDQSKWGPNNAAYPGKVAAAYQALAQRHQTGQAAAAAPKGPDATDAFLSGATGAEAGKAAAAPDATDAFLAGKEEAAAEAQKTSASGGIARNAAAGVLDAAGNAINIASDPAGNLVGKPLATAAVFAHDALAPYLGYERFPADVRNMLLGDNVPQPGTRLADAAGAGGVSADTTAERLVRKGVGGAGAAAAIGASNPLLMSLVGGAGAVSGDVAASYAPDWAKPAAELGGNILGAAATVPAGLVARGGVNALRAGVTRFANPPGMDDIPTMTVRPGEAPAGPSPGMGGPSPNAAGAQAATAAEAEMSNATMKANRRQAEVAEVNAPAAASDETFVEGSHLTLAQRAANPTTSQHETMLAQRNPDAFTGDSGIYGQQNAARVDKFRNLTPSDTQIDNWRTEQKALAQTDKAAVMEHAQPADLEPAVAHLDGLMSDKRLQESPEIMATVGKLKETLYDADGNLKTDPLSVWGMHDNIKNMIEKSKDKTSVERFAQSQLIEFKNIIDDAMNKATDGHFQVFLDHWADYAKRINAGELLGKFESLRLTNAKGNIQPNTFHKFVRDLAYSRGKRGLDPSMDIPDQVMQNLIAIDKDLKQAGLIDLGAVRGSPTNLFGVLAKDMGIGVAHMGLVAADMAHGGMGNILLQGALKRGGEAFNMLRMRSLTRKHLAEPKGGWKPVAEQYRTPDWNALDKP